MLRVIIKSVLKIKNFTILSSFAILIFLTIVVYNNYSGYTKKPSSLNLQNPDLNAVKEFLISKIRSPFLNVNYIVKSGDSIQSILKKFRVDRNEIQNVIREYKKYSNPNKLMLGTEVYFVIKKGETGEKNSISNFSTPITKSTAIDIYKTENNKMSSKKIITKLYKKKVLADNIILNSLYDSAEKANIDPGTIIEFARIFGFEIDFQRDIRKKDYFKIVYEKYFDEDGEFVKSGSILYAHMNVNGREISLYKFGKDKDYGYFDENGKSVEKALMKTPINGARLSSSFGIRKHPILGFNKLHTGTDFAAPMGTPIMASGSGTITRAKWCGGGGNCIKIKHNSTYETVYAHMKSFAKGMKVGKKVRQGQIIGYVGSTGMSTGPHLHYEVIVNGKKVNSQTLKLPSGKTLKDEERKNFEIHRIKTDVLIAELVEKKLGN
tara:strand:- start:459 stop:1766 length:1308 start_codon:yes stop_codon:yes gene_type:complete